MTSERPAAEAEETRLLSTVLPRFSRMEVGRSSRISLAKEERREEGSREVVTRIRGSTTPDSWAYSSSSERVSERVSVGRDSS